MTVQTADAEMLSKIEVLADLEEVVADLMRTHEAKRILWFPSEILAPPPDEDPDRHRREHEAHTRPTPRGRA